MFPVLGRVNSATDKLRRMARIYADCPVDGFQPAGGAIDIEGDGDLLLVGNSIECPRCKRPVPIVDGKYEVSGSRQTITPISPANTEQLRRLESALRNARHHVRSKDVPDEEVAAELEEDIRRESPQLASFLDRLASKRSVGVAAWLGILIMVLGWFIDSQGSTSTEELEQMLERVIESDIPAPEDAAPEELPIEPEPKKGGPGRAPGST